MRRKTTARRFFSILLNSRLALFAFGVSAVGLPLGLLPGSRAIAEEPAKQGPPSKDQRTASDYAKAIRLAPTGGSNQISWWSVLAFAFTGFLCVGSAIPLILQRVPPNPWYGFRVQATLENPAVWYPANRSRFWEMSPGVRTVCDRDLRRALPRPRHQPPGLHVFVCRGPGNWIEHLAHPDRPIPAIPLCTARHSSGHFRRMREPITWGSGSVPGRVIVDPGRGVPRPWAPAWGRKLPWCRVPRVLDLVGRRRGSSAQAEHPEPAVGIGRRRADGQSAAHPWHLLGWTCRRDATTP